MKTITSVEAQNNFGSLMTRAHRSPITITKHGKPHVVMIAYEDLPEFGLVSFADLPNETQNNIQTSRTLSEDNFYEF